MAFWLILQGIGIFQSIFDSIIKLDPGFVATALIETYCWICVLSLYRKLKQNYIVVYQNPSK
jgi:hypothetical protein